MDQEIVATKRDFDFANWTRPDAIVEPRSELISLYDEGFCFYRDRLEAARGRWSGPALSPT